jgi:hypothetical protein
METPDIKILSEAETELVSGGDSYPNPTIDVSEYWQDQLLRYKTGLSSVFGEQ